jgi:hypothetical protein
MFLFQRLILTKMHTTIRYSVSFQMVLPALLFYYTVGFIFLIPPVSMRGSCEEYWGVL